MDSGNECGRNKHDRQSELKKEKDGAHQVWETGELASLLDNE